MSIIPGPHGGRNHRADARIDTPPAVPAHVELAVTVREVAEHLAQAFEELDWSPATFTGVDDLGAIAAALHGTALALGEVVDEALLQLEARTSALVATGSTTDALALRRAHRSLQLAARLQCLAARCLDHSVEHLDQVARSRTTASALRVSEA